LQDRERKLVHSENEQSRATAKVDVRLGKLREEIIPINILFENTRLTNFPINRRCCFSVLAHAKFIFRAIRANHTRTSFYGDSRAITHPAGRPHLVDRYRYLVDRLAACLWDDLYSTKVRLPLCQGMRAIEPSPACRAMLIIVRVLKTCEIASPSSSKMIHRGSRSVARHKAFNLSKTEPCCYLSVIKDFTSQKVFSLAIPAQHPQICRDYNEIAREERQHLARLPVA